MQLDHRGGGGGGVVATIQGILMVVFLQRAIPACPGTGGGSPWKCKQILSMDPTFPRIPRSGL